MSYLREPITISQLIQLTESQLDPLNLYRKEEGWIDEASILYLDDPVEVDDETDEEIYPDFAEEQGLTIYFFGQVAADIIANTRHQIQQPSVQDYVKNFNYYDEHDSFFTFG